MATPTSSYDRDWAGAVFAVQDDELELKNRSLGMAGVDCTQFT